MSAGYTLSVADLRSLAQQYAQSYISLMVRSQQFMQRVSDFGSAAIQAAYNDVNDTAALEAMVQAVGSILLYATTVATSTTSTTDNTAGTATESVSVPVGSLAVVTSDPAVIAILKSLSADKSTPIRVLSPLSPV